MAKKPCTSCGGRKSSLKKTISRVLKLGATTKKSVDKTEKKNVDITGGNNTPPNPVFPSSPILKKTKDYIQIDGLIFPSRGTFLDKLKKFQKDKKDKEKKFTV